MKAAIRKAALYQAVEERLGEDHVDVAFSRTVLRFGEQLCSQQEAADPMVVAASVVLLCLAGRDPAAVMPRGDGGTQGATGTEEVARILRDLHYAPDVIERVSAIHEMLAESRPPPAPDNLEYALVHDALLLASLEHRHTAGEAALPEAVVAQCLTDGGRSVAIELGRSLRPSLKAEAPE
ncbi:MAG: hypothetical protein GXP31_19315 [Kiritimatiellaeota bacterium]|nr:hypothetical protein [Kiritimatiellota bacterium]